MEPIQNYILNSADEPIERTQELRNYFHRIYHYMELFEEGEVPNFNNDATFDKYRQHEIAFLRHQVELAKKSPKQKLEERIQELGVQIKEDLANAGGVFNFYHHHLYDQLKLMNAELANMTD